MVEIRASFSNTVVLEDPEQVKPGPAVDLLVALQGLLRKTGIFTNNSFI